MQQRLTKKELKALRKEERVAEAEQMIKTKQQNKLILVGSVIVGLLLIGWIWKSAQLPIPPSEKDKPLTQILPQDWSLGNKEAPLKVIEYSDLQCPACKAFAGVDSQLVQIFGDRVGVAYRHFPLRELHQNANIAAQAAEAAGKQGKFWEMAAILFDKQDEWSESNQPLNFFKGYAQQIGLNTETFTKDVESKDTKALVEADYLSALVAKVSATPTFFVNGQKMNNLRGPEDLIARVDLMLKEATQSAVQPATQSAIPAQP